MNKKYCLIEKGDLSKNRGSGHNKSPYQILKEKQPLLDDKILNLTPIRLEWLKEEMMTNNDYKKSVYHLPLLPKNVKHLNQNLFSNPPNLHT